MKHMSAGKILLRMANIEWNVFQVSMVGKLLVLSLHLRVAKIAHLHDDDLRITRNARYPWNKV
jgi:hypothetical protein